MLSLRFVKRGLLAVEVVKDFKLLLSRRTDVDYGDFDTVDRRDAEDSIRLAERMISVIDAARKRLLLS